MPYFIQGSMADLARLFRQQWMTDIGARSDQVLAADLTRFSFLGSVAQSKAFIPFWMNSPEKKYYCQGNIHGSNLRCLPDALFLKAEHESFDEYVAACESLSFAYLNEQGEPCGLNFFYRKNDPAQWGIGLIKNGHLAPKDRTIMLLSSTDLQAFIAPSESPCAKVTQVSTLSNPLVDALGSSFVAALYKEMLSNDRIHPQAQRIKLLYQFFHYQNDALLLDESINLTLLDVPTFFAKNVALDFAARYNCPLSKRALEDCMLLSSTLNKELKQLILVADERINECLVSMIIAFYEADVLASHRAFIEDHLLKQTTEQGILWNKEQIEAACFLLSQGYPEHLCDLILSKQYYYEAVLVLKELGLSQDIPARFADPDKLLELEYIYNHAKDKRARALCHLFWIKGELQYSEYQQIIDASKHYPLMVTTLIALDNEGLISIDELKSMALDPRQYIKHSIVYHFNAQVPKRISLQGQLEQLHLSELLRCSQAYTVLQRVKRPAEDYVATLDNTHSGQLLRLFLSHLIDSFDPIYCQTMVDLLFVGVNKGPFTQGNMARAQKDPALKKAAMTLHESFICAKQLQGLHLDLDIISLVTETRNEDAIQLRKIILRVEEQCKKINEHLRSSQNKREILLAWETVANDYRCALYQIAYDALGKKDNAHALERLKVEQEKVLAIVDPQVKSKIHKILILLANIVIGILTLSFAHAIKYKTSGNSLFFTQTSSGEALRALESDIQAIIKPKC